MSHQARRTECYASSRLQLSTQPGYQRVVDLIADVDRLGTPPADAPDWSSSVRVWFSEDSGIVSDFQHLLNGLSLRLKSQFGCTQNLIYLTDQAQQGQRIKINIFDHR